MIRKILLIVLLLFALPLSSAYESSVAIAMGREAGTPNLQPVMLRYEPFPVNPGEYVDVWLKFENEEDTDITDLSIELMPEFPFSIDASESSTRHFGYVFAHSIVLVKYRVRVSEDAVEGDRLLKYRYRYVESDLKWTEANEKIRVQTREAILSIESVESVPEKIVPGQNAKVTIKLKNRATSVIRDIGFFLDLTMSTIAKNPATLSPSSIIIDSYYNAIPLVPLNSSTEKRIGYLRPGEETEIVYDLIAFPDATSKIYKIPVVMTYQDEVGLNYTKADIIGLIIGSEPDLSVTIEENTVYSAKTAGEISIKIVNKGVTDIKFMNVLLKKSDDYDVVSSNEVYLGDIDSDDYETAEFKIYVKDLEKRNMLKIPLRLQYKDSNNKEFQKDVVLEMKAYSQKERGMAGGSSLTTIIIVLILLAAGWFGYKRWEKKKKEKKK